ncbi:MAG: 4Fe-4S dicluster domain-containing protein [Oscillospiraceae bacterium]|nr:4Fe-4S dicluster domain-containing protein [Oscillospiraceae bacterium]
MKRVYVNEKWCLGCHLCEYYCAFANSGVDDMAKALKNVEINPKIRVEGDNKVSFAVQCRHCDNPLCVKGCISGALTKGDDGIVRVNQDKCVGCFTCVLSCPYGCITPSGTGVIQKCELCTQNGMEPACVQGCPNQAIVYEER